MTCAFISEVYEEYVSFMLQQEKNTQKFSKLQEKQIQVIWNAHYFNLPFQTQMQTLMSPSTCQASCQQYPLPSRDYSQKPGFIQHKDASDINTKK